ncbi:GNAT family N-acetyltransferase [Fischerella thermalis CCMEE 5201]|jgi:RimJ/RimL family protein N-acetyltransferase|nr:GNAT family N-acetyltransferase [Fischerella thermalis CCMEE 5201]
MPEIETARLRLRPYTLDDVDETAVILSNPEVMKYSPRGPIPEDQVKEVTQQILEFFIQHWKQHGFGVWAVVDKATNKLLGHCGLNFLPNSPEVEVLYRLDQAYWNQGIATEATKASLRYAPSLIFGVLPQFWGRGYATEATLGVLDHAFTDLGIKYIVADVDEPNDRSIRVLEKIGMSRTKRAIVNEKPLLYYEIYAADRGNRE